MVENQGQVGPEHKFSKEKLTTLMALYHFETFEDALDTVRAIYEVGGKGHSCGIYSHDDDHIDQLARVAPVSRMMVRQAQSKANAGAYTNGMPMTSSLGCGIWGGNITNENVSLKHYMNLHLGQPAHPRRPPLGSGTLRRIFLNRRGVNARERSNMSTTKDRRGACRR